MTQSAEQDARDMLERLEAEGAQSMTSGDVVELANAIAHAHAWDIVAASPRFAEVQTFAARRGITWAAAVVELINAGLSCQPNFT